MLLFAAVLDVASGAALACADHSGTSGHSARKSATGSELLRAASDACHWVSSKPAIGRQLEARTVGEMRLLSYIYGSRGFFAAVPMSRFSSTMVAVAFLGDVAARWDTGDLDDKGLHVLLVHFATARVVGDDAFVDADALAATAGTAGSKTVSTAASAPMVAWTSSAASPTAPPLSPQLVAASRQAAAELRASRQADSLVLAERVAELESSKRQMEEHSEALLRELQSVREQQLTHLNAQARSAAEAAERRRHEQAAAAAERERAAEAWAARVAELQEALTRTSKEHEAAKAAHRESDEQWAQRERRLREQLIEVSDEVEAA
eukprot:jgi/Chrpa1/6639/Chrysochromulina_OHIO_Genome00014250-RA